MLRRFLRGRTKPAVPKPTMVSAVPCSRVDTPSVAEGPVWFHENTFPCGDNALTGVDVVVL